MTTWLKNNGEKEIELNDEPATIKAAIDLGWKLKEADDKSVNEMDLDELKVLADKIGISMATNIGLSAARKKLKAAIEA